MAQTQTLSFIHEIESLVSDKLQVVSYKWLSRNYMVSSDEAKRLLQEFVQKHEGGLEVVYALSGWLKSNHPSYHVRLVTGPKLAEAQQEFDGDCSVQVYSVQASIPKDPAVLWNAEFIQAEELFKQPSSVDNCLRDNRFCGISNSFVERNVDGPTVFSAAPQSKSIVGEGPTKSNTVHHPPKNVACDSIYKVDTKPQNVVKDVKSESNGMGNSVVLDNINKPTADKEKALPLPTGKKKVQADKSGSVTGGSLASFWGRASAKPKPHSPPAENNNTISNPAVATEDGQTSAREAEESDSGNDDNQDVSLRRSSNRKRRVVFDFSDEDEDEVVNLASPDFPNKQSSQDSRLNDKKSSDKATLNFDSQEENKPRVKEERATDQKAHLPLRENVSAISKCTNTGKSSSEKLHSCAPEVCVNKDSVNNAPPCSPKRRKVMKTMIDERGREVTEVVWEGEETEEKKPDKVTTKKSDSNASTKAVNSAPATKKPPANSNTISGKGGNKKAGNSKDPKQGNILSFFKRV
ncbi:DNA polymerase delta subunit 3 [Spatholobus suberectus]|nr:DNA polymerase delta subunit 3 [Spatholobus suberectus]